MYNCYERKGLFRIDVQQGYKPPKRYGLAYWRYDAPVTVCYPLLLNWAVWIARETYFRIAYPPKAFNEDAYKAGMEEGMRIQKILDDTDDK